MVAEVSLKSAEGFACLQDDSGDGLKKPVFSNDVAVAQSLSGKMLAVLGSVERFISNRSILKLVDQNRNPGR